jgi:hypothetical protein
MAEDFYNWNDYTADEAVAFIDVQERRSVQPPLQEGRKLNGEPRLTKMGGGWTAHG